MKRFDVYLIAQVGASVELNLQRDLPSQLFTLEEQQELFPLLADIRVVSITPAFAVLVAPPIGPITKMLYAQLDRCKQQKIIDLYRIVAR